MQSFDVATGLVSRARLGVYGESTGVIIRAIGRCLVEATGDPREANWFRQNLAIAIQRGNAFSILSAGRERF